MIRQWCCLVPTALLSMYVWGESSDCSRISYEDISCENIAYEYEVPEGSVGVLINSAGLYDQLLPPGTYSASSKNEGILISTEQQVLSIRQVPCVTLDGFHLMFPKFECLTVFSKSMF